LALRLASQGASVFALDFSEAMLGVALGKTSSRSIMAEEHQIRFVRGDAQRLPFAADSFDAVTVGYGLRNLASWEAGLREMRRVAKPGGRLVVLDFGKPDHPAWRRLYFGYLKLCVPCLGRVVCGNAAAYSYILDSLYHYPAQHGVAACMAELGLRNMRIINLLAGAMTINVGEKPLPI
jgi:demethylmenaquinone methyltransferase/2-methoxy-6-polyprenyl-1,4-benzoquinol methylase